MKDKILLAQKKWRDKNKDKIVAYRKKYNKENAEKVNKANKDWRDKHKWIVTFWLINRRCSDKDNERYHRYGGRGIKCNISEEELKELWFRDKAYFMKRPTIDRINNDGHYELHNCRYIEASENARKGNT